MAEYDPFEPQQSVAPGGGDFAELSRQWNQFLDDPRGRSALINFGTALMQPVGVGQSAAGHVGQAFGNVGAGLQQQELLDIKGGLAENRVATDREKLAQGADKIDLGYERLGSREDREAANLQLKREIAAARQSNDSRRAGILEQQLAARMKYDEGRLGIGQQNADTAVTRAETGRMNADTNKLRASSPSFNTLFRANERQRNAFDKDIVSLAKDIEKRVNDPFGLSKPLQGEERFKGMNTQQIAAELAKDPQVKQNIMSRRGQAAPTLQGDEESDSGVPAQIESAPLNAGQRVPNTVYQTPRGPMRWTGTGWIPAR